MFISDAEVIWHVRSRDPLDRRVQITEGFFLNDSSQLGAKTPCSVAPRER